MYRGLRESTVYACLLAATVGYANAEPNSPADWPMYRGNNARTADGTQALATPLHPQWTHVANHAPRPAWPEPGKEIHRMAFDYSYQVAVADGRLFYGSSADDEVHALDLDSGKQLWSFFTEGPVRFAPAVSAGRVFAASDDGYLYCLNCSDGKLIWRFRGGPRDDRFLGNGRMISRWPGRSGVLVEGDSVYFTAGMWGPDGIHVYRLNAADGSVRWKNSTANQMYMMLPHNNYEGISGVSPQGYLAMGEEVLLVPTGRAMPARFDRATGKLLPWKIAWGKHHKPGSSWTMAGKGLFFSARRSGQGLPSASLGENSRMNAEGIMAWDLHTGEAVLALHDVYRSVLSGNTIYLTSGGYSGRNDGDVLAIDFDKLPTKALRQGPWHGGFNDSAVMTTKIDKEVRWRTPVGRVHELIKSGNTLVAGGYEFVELIDANTGALLWKTNVEGQARGLAVAEGRLLVSTSTGHIYCFGEEEIVESPVAGGVKTVAGESKQTHLAKEIIETTNIRSGYCLVLGLDDPELVLGLIQQSDLQVVVQERDEEKVARARRRFDQLGYHGVRVAIHRVAPRELPYSQYFANLVVVGNPASCNIQQVYRSLRPCGGYLVLPGESRSVADARQWLSTVRVHRDEILDNAKLVCLKRGPLPGAGTWSHPFANPGRTSATKDKHVKLPLKTLWFGGPGPSRMLDRHIIPSMPAYAHGRLYIPGQHHIIGVDAYNGREMWSREFTGVGRLAGQDRGANVVADETSVFVLHGTRCLQLDGNTGKTLRVFQPPSSINLEALQERGDEKARYSIGHVEWNHLVVTDTIVLGTVGSAGVYFRGRGTATPQGTYLFALDKRNGEPLWIYEPKHVVSPKSVVVDDRRVYLLDHVNDKSTDCAGILKALDIDTGKTIWETPQDSHWELLLSDNILVVAGMGHSAYDADTGQLRWSNAVPFLLDTPVYGAGIDHYRWCLKCQIQPRVAPMIVGGELLVPPRAYNLKTGEERFGDNPLSGEPIFPLGLGNGGCGSFSACPSAMFLRSGSLGIYDLARNTGMHWLGQLRSGCWINTLPAGGMVLIPEAASSCTCTYSFQTSIALVAEEETRHEEWGVYLCQDVKRGSRLKSLHCNFGAVGEKRDNAGELWLGFPRPFSPQALKIPLVTRGESAFYHENADETAIAGTDRPWLYACGAKGLDQAVIDLNLTRPVVAPRVAAAPVIDGRLDDPCWNGAEAIEFVDDSRRVDDRVRAWLRHDEKNFYIGFHRKAARVNGKNIPWTANEKNDSAAVWLDDSLKIRFQEDTTPFDYLLLSASGARFTGKGERSKTMWATQRQWDSAVHLTDEAWTAEMAIPFESSEKSLGQKTLRIFLESFNKSGVGAERVFHKHRSWRRFYVGGGEADVVLDTPPEPPARDYTVRLHFAEIQRIEPGMRVFDVKVQGKTVIERLDIVSETGGFRRALVKEITPVKASRTITVDFTPSFGSMLPSIISGVEIIQVQ